ncbi:glutathionyl-hydroquinone reductase YqjG-like [Clytia hemisphaerica]|uniref:GST N-terminal domain-containing protein n=1 Tax=Clytia hemisphaerica TaxID=252671 RepID=A0A7M5WIL9_9CNID|eukprot:TCONS_00011186-protein
MGASDILGQVTKDGSSGFKAEKDRYHLYTAHGCPFAHRAVIGRKLKGLEDVITMSFVESVKKDATKSYHFSTELPDPINGKEFLMDVYLHSHPEYSGSATVPVLFDKQTQKIVSNSSADILRMLDQEFNELSKTGVNLYPEDLRKDIDELNDWITQGIVTAVYRVGRGYLGKNQEMYDTEVAALFQNIDKVEEILQSKRYLAGSQITEADVRLMVVLLRFDTIYYSLYKCSKRTLVSYKNLWGYVRDIYQTFDLAPIVNLVETKIMYFKAPAYSTLDTVVPVGPELNFNEPHGREMIK